MTDIRPNIWLLQAKGDVDGLTEALQSDDPDTRRRAAVALRALGSGKAVMALRAALQTEEDTVVRSDMFEALEHLLQDRPESTRPDPEPPEPEETPVEKLVGQLDPNKIEHTLHVIEVLGEMQDPVAAEPLIRLFDNRNLPEKLRLAAAEALLKMESAPAIVTLLRALRGDSWHVRRNAAGIMGHLRTDWAVEPLGVALSDENPFVRRTARAALKRIGTSEAKRILTENPDEAEPKLITRRPRRYNISSDPPPPQSLRSETTARGTKPKPPAGLLEQAQQKEPPNTPAPPAVKPTPPTITPTRPSQPKSLKDRLIDTRPLPPEVSDTLPVDTRPLPPEVSDTPLVDDDEDLLDNTGSRGETIKFSKDDLPDVPAHPAPETEETDPPSDSAE